MGKSDLITSPEQLLGHAGFVRRLACSLLRDEHAVDDVVQETWLASLERPPDSDWPARAWLAGVVRNLVRSRKRRDARRTIREKRAATAESVCSTDRVVEQESIRRSVVEAVLLLDEPYRSAILMRFYHEWPPREMARHLDLSVNTVKTRLQRGLELLKGRLSSYHGEGQGGWTHAILPLAGLTGAASSTPVSAAPLISGALLMSSPVKVGLLAAITGFAVLTLLFLVPISPLFLFESAAQESESSPVTDGGGPGANVPDRANLPEDPNPPGDRIPVEPSGPVFSGRVVDAVSGKPVRAFDFYLFKKKPRDHSRAVDETVHHEEGRFSFRLHSGGEYQLQLASSRHIARTLFELQVDAERGLNNLLLELDPGNAMAGQVVDAQTGKPVAGAIVTSNSCLVDTLESIARGDKELYPNTISDRKGLFHFSGMRRGHDYRIIAVHPGYALGWARYNPDEGGFLTISMNRGFTISGRTCNDGGEAASGIRILYRHQDSPSELRVTSGANGYFETMPVPPGKILLTALGQKPLDGNPFGFTAEKQTVSIVDRNVELSFGPSDDLAAWRGVVRDANGNPVPGARLVVRCDLSWSWHDRHNLPSMKRSLICPSDGSFEFLKIPRGRFKVSLSERKSADWEYGNNWTETFREPGTVERDLVLGPCRVTGVVIDEASGLPVAGDKLRVVARSTDGEDRKVSVTCDESGRFRIDGLFDGDYRLGVESRRAATGREESITLYGHQILDGVLLPVRRKGRLLLNLVGFDDPDARRFRYSCSRLESPDTIVISVTTGVRGVCKRDLEAGKWLLHLSYPTKGGTGYLREPFEISPGQATELTIPRERMRFRGGGVTVTGRLSRSDGTGVSGGKVTFSQHRMMRGMNWEDPPLTAVRATSGADGQIRVKGLGPGFWHVRARLPDLGIRRFADLSISQESGTVHHDFQAAGGSVSGRFVDAVSGEPIEDGGIEWTVIFEPSLRHGSPVVCRQEGRGGAFHIPAVPSGQHDLVVSVPGYRTFRLDRLDLGEIRHHDLGRIPLKAGGWIEMEVADSQGKPVEWLEISVGGRHFSIWSNNRNQDGAYKIRRINDFTFSITDLPTGELELVIGANGCLCKRRRVDIQPGVPTRVPVKLDSEP